MPFITSLVCVFSLVLAPWGQREKWEGCASCATSLKILGTLPFWFSWSVCVMLELAHPEGLGRAPMGSCCVFNPAPSLRASTAVQSRWGFADAGGHCSFWGQKLRYGAGRRCPWGGLMSLGTSSGPPAPHRGAAKVGHSPAPWGQDGSCRSHPSLSSLAPPELRAQQAYLY